METMRAKRRAAAKRCEENGIEPGDKIEALYSDGWASVTVTAIGQSAILTRRKGAGEYPHHGPAKLRVVTTAVD